MKIYTDKDVLTASEERIEYAFEHFDNLCVSVSGGKDSGVLVQLVDRVARRLGRCYDAMHADVECSYTETMAFVDRLKKLPALRDFYHFALPMTRHNALSQIQTEWACWDPDERDKWVRELPADAYTIDNVPFEWGRPYGHLRDFLATFERWYQRQHGGSAAFAVGIRADESLNRYKVVGSTDKKGKYDNVSWTTARSNDVYLIYPIYDFSAEDVWGATARLDLDYNNVYDLMYYCDIPLHEQRICEPFGDEQRRGLDQYKQIEPGLWDKLIFRVEGVLYGDIYAKTELAGYRKSMKPRHMSWEEYAVYMLDGIGIYNRDLMLRYHKRIKSIVARCGDDTDWRQIARGIEKNDVKLANISKKKEKDKSEKISRLAEMVMPERRRSEEGH